MYRLFVVGVVTMWLAAMVALVAQDMWPVWTVQDPPPMTPEKLKELTQAAEQCGIIDQDGNRLGTAWRDVSPSSVGTLIDSRMRLTSFKGMPPIRIRTSREFNGKGELDSFKMNVYGMPGMTISAHGERNGPYIACQLDVGHLHQTTRLDASASRMIGESMNPFSVLPELKVGQRGRMQVLDPITAALGRQTNFRAVIAEVTRSEKIVSPLDGSEVECFVVELSANRAKAWVTGDGKVLRQEVTMPMVGKVTVEAEKFDKAAYEEMRGQDKPVNKPKRKAGNAGRRAGSAD